MGRGGGDSSYPVFSTAQIFASKINGYVCVCGVCVCVSQRIEHICVMAFVVLSFPEACLLIFPIQNVRRCENKMIQHITSRPNSVSKEGV